ncbi:MAG: MucR family transcriptional regulator [Desulfobacteraceae bacterium]|jgi:predicted transcriptional regulator
MAKSLYELAAEIVSAQAAVSKLTPEEINELIKTTYDSLKSVKANEEGAEAEEAAPAMDPKKSIKQNSVTCLECGKKFKILTKRHLKEHGLTPKEYRKKWGFKARQPLSAKSLSAKRRKVAKEKNLGQRLAEARKKQKQG